jgi:iron-sulfur cluster repair protein YtfE (RIC family)
LTRFTAALQRHLICEEIILFPLFEQKTGQSGLTDTLRGEHELRSEARRQKGATTVCIAVRTVSTGQRGR